MLCPSLLLNLTNNFGGNWDYTYFIHKYLRNLKGKQVWEHGAVSHLKITLKTGSSAVASALALGARGPGFKSRLPD